MLEEIYIKNFKSFQEAEINLSALNLFTGLNGMGKSSFIQVLLLMRQTYLVNKRFEKELILQRDLVNIGLGVDAAAEYRTDDKIRFELGWESEVHLDCEIKYSPEIAEFDILPAEFQTDIRGTEALFSHRFEYLNALRISPANHFGFSTYDVEKLDSLGTQGEYSLHYLDKFAREEINIKALAHPDSDDDFTLAGQVELWMSYISPGLRIEPFTDRNSEMSGATFSYEIAASKTKTKDFKPKNVGFGITYVLPVILSVLKAAPGDFIIIENPESHVHPRGQAQLGELFAIAAQNGVQLIIETHSDHVLNGIRVATKRKMIAPENVGIFFFKRDRKSDEHLSVIVQPMIDENGRLDEYPEDFFDEWSKRLDDLLD